MLRPLDPCWESGRKLKLRKPPLVASGEFSDRPDFDKYSGKVDVEAELGGVSLSLYGQLCFAGRNQDKPFFTFSDGFPENVFSSNDLHLKSFL